MDITEEEAVKKVREFKPIYLVAFVVPILLFFFLSIVLIYFLVASYRDQLIKESIDSYGYNPEVEFAKKKDSAILDGYGWADEEKQIMHVPLGWGGNAVIERYKSYKVERYNEKYRNKRPSSPSAAEAGQTQGKQAPAQ